MIDLCMESAGHSNKISGVFAVPGMGSRGSCIDLLGFVFFQFLFGGVDGLIR
jgi:hypothetical protein